MKQLDRTAAAYCRSVARMLPVYGKRRSAYLKTLQQDADRYLKTHPWASGAELETRFGRPKEIADAFVSEMSFDEINARFRARNRVVLIALLAAGVALALLLGGIVLMYLRNAQDLNGYYIIT